MKFFTLCLSAIKCHHSTLTAERGINLYKKYQTDIPWVVRESQVEGWVVVCSRYLFQQFQQLERKRISKTNQSLTTVMEWPLLQHFYSNMSILRLSVYISTWLNPECLLWVTHRQSEDLEITASHGKKHDTKIASCRAPLRTKLHPDFFRSHSLHNTFTAPSYICPTHKKCPNIPCTYNAGNLMIVSQHKPEKQEMDNMSLWENRRRITWGWSP